MKVVQYLCDLRGYCSLGFSLPTPYSLMDNTEHVIYAYGLDTRDSSAVLLTDVRQPSPVLLNS